MNSSPDSLNPSQSTSSSSPPTESIQPQSLIERFSAKHTSKIPIPVLSKHRSRQSILNNNNNNQQHMLKTQLHDSITQSNGSIEKNSKVDQIIADLLIEALNHSTDIGIEFIKAPKNLQSNVKLNQTKRANQPKPRRTNGMPINGNIPNSGGKRSSHGSAKYQQVFDSIPEEKSGSLSIESPNEENGTSTADNHTDVKDKKIEIKKTKGVSPPPLSINGITNKRSPPSKLVTNGNLLVKIASGKAAIESDQDKSDAWFGCFGRTHVDSPVDGLLMDEGIFKYVHNTSLAV